LPAVPHRLALARLFAEELDRLPEAIAEYDAVLAADENSVAAARALVELLGREERWPAFAAALARAAELETEAARAVELRLQLADVQAARLDDAAGAQATYERVLADEPGSAGASEALDALEKLARKGERWGDLARVLEQKAQRAGDAAVAARLRRERADVLSQKLGDVEASIRELEAVLAGDPDNRAAAARHREALREAGPRRRFAARHRAARRPRGVGRRAAAPAAAARRRVGGAARGPGWRGRRARSARARCSSASCSSNRTTRTRSGRSRACTSKRGGTSRSRRPSSAGARSRPTGPRAARSRRRSAGSTPRSSPIRRAPVEAYGEAEALGDESPTTLAALARLHEAAGRWAPAADTLEKLARSSADTTTRTDALVRAAAIALERQDDRATAEARYARALELDPDNLGALSALGALYRRQGELLRAAKLMREG
jgi:tetratricopeptide (TPR) repeat protein